MKNPFRWKIFRAAMSILKPEPTLTVSEWADQYRFIARGTSPEPGRWKTSRVPYARGIMDAFNSDAEIIVFMAGSQVAKSEIALNVLGYFIHQDPSAIMYLLPTDGLAEDFSKTRIQKTIDDTPVLRELFSNKSRDGDNTISLKNFPGGYIAIHGASTPTKLSSKPIRILLQDEIDRFVPSAGTEGSPIKLANQRTTNFFNRKIGLFSTPTIQGKSNIEEWFLNSNQSYYHVPCPDCGHMFVFKWEMVKWQKSDDGELIEDSVYLECPACFYHITDKDKESMLSRGEWRASKPQRTMPGFHISSLYSPWLSFSKLVREWLEATKTKDRIKLKEFINLKLGEVFVLEQEEIDIEQLEHRREYYEAELPDGVLCITAGIDTQNDRFAIQYLGWGHDEECWVLRYHEIPGDLNDYKVWDDLDSELGREFKFKDGKRLIAALTCMDTGGSFTDDVYRWIKPREVRRIYGIKGRGGNLPINNGFTRNNSYKIPLFTIGVDTAKELVMSRLLSTFEDSHGYIHFPRDLESGCNRDYFKMLCSEQQVTQTIRGQTKTVWKKIHARNESLDTFVYALAALRILRPNFKRIQEKLEAQPDGSLLQSTQQKNVRTGVLSKGVEI